MAPSNKRLKALAKTIPDEHAIRGLLRLLENRTTGSDYAVAIIGASLIERALEAAILSRFAAIDTEERARLFGFEQKGPLADMGLRNRIGLALGLYGRPTFDDLEKIRLIRNLFAHATTIRKFSDQAIAEACLEFNVLDFVFGHEKGTHREPPKSAYVSACLHIAGRLRGRLEGSSSEDAPAITFPMEDGILP